MGYFPRSKVQQAIDAALSDERLEEYLAGDVEAAWDEMDRCLQKVDDDEPIFVLRAQDARMLPTMEFWRAAATNLTDDHKLEFARHREAVKQWQLAHADRVKEAD